MLIAYRARSADDARNACDVLAAAGIATHVPDRINVGFAGSGQIEIIPVLVDNRSLGSARRALQRWIGEKART